MRTPVRRWDQSKEPVPDWLPPYVAYVADCLGLHEWDLNCRVVEVLEEDRPQTAARCTSSPMYFQAQLEFRAAEFQDENQEAREMVVHELLHAALAHFVDMASSTALMLADKRQRTQMQGLLDLQEENFIVRLSRALLPVLGEPKAEVKCP